jgi:hypothetical protein
MTTREERITALKAIAWIEVKDDADLLRQVEQLALGLGDSVEFRRNQNDEYWWHDQDRLDDVMGILEYLQKKNSGY